MTQLVDAGMDNARRVIDGELLIPLRPRATGRGLRQRLTSSVMQRRTT